MSLQQTPSANRLHIGILGRRNAGKSSLINALTNQNLAIVSDHKGTTTDPVQKAMELPPLGPVVLIDTPGIDDSGELGLLRVEKTHQALRKTDFCLLVIDGREGFSKHDENLANILTDKKIPFILVVNKTDLLDETTTPKALAAQSLQGQKTYPQIQVSCQNRYNIDALKALMGEIGKQADAEKPLVKDLIAPGALVLLVTPIDEAAPKGRLILPQQQVIRELVEHGVIVIVIKETEITHTLSQLGKAPDLVITDSQAFAVVAEQLPKEVLLTSFSILFARFKGSLTPLIQGASVIDSLQDGDKVLISEGCTHHRQCNDIGTVKLPAWLKKHTGKELSWDFSSGTEFPASLSKYALVIHCGGCVLNEKEMKHRMKSAKEQQVPMTNYGTAIAFMNGILARSLAVFE